MLAGGASTLSAPPAGVGAVADDGLSVVLAGVLNADGTCSASVPVADFLAAATASAEIPFE